MQQKISYWSCLFEIFFIASTHLQRLKFLKNAWDGVKLLHFNKTIFSIKTFIKGVYLLQILLKEFLNRIWKGYFLAHLSVVAFDNINFEFIITASYLTKPVDYWMKETKISPTMVHYWEVLVKYLDEVAIGLVRSKKPSRQKFCKLWQVCRPVWRDKQ